MARPRDPVKINLKHMKKSATRLTKTLEGFQRDVRISLPQIVHVLTRDSKATAKKNFGKNYIERNKYTAKWFNGPKTKKDIVVRGNTYTAKMKHASPNTPYVEGHEEGKTLLGGKRRDETGKDHPMPTRQARLSGSLRKSVKRNLRKWGNFIKGKGDPIKEMARAKQEGKLYMPQKKVKGRNILVKVTKAPNRRWKPHTLVKKVQGGERLFVTELVYFFEKPARARRRKYFWSESKKMTSGKNLKKQVKQYLMDWGFERTIRKKLHKK